MAEMEVRKLRHDPTELITRAVQPILWLTIFGQAMSRIRAVPTGGFTYLQFMTPGILAQSVVFISIFYGLSIIWERDMGVLQKFLVTPTPREALVLGKMISAGIRGISQAIIVLFVAAILQVHLHVTFLRVLGVILVIMLGAGFFAGFSMIIASIVKTRERFMGMGQIITMPLFFASNALYPISIMPLWLRFISVANPLSYIVEALRSLLVVGDLTRLPLDICVLAVACLAVTVISALMYPRVVT
ncbi:MAG TPA: ABC transporter permease [Firmicutes bacterium]|nr:ABC transporter permease [Bacillota bacterium]HHY98945.1 ABC transporter permease [Bacillota bacterium]